MPDPLHVITELSELIESRYADRPADSYTTRLFEGGVERIGAKIREEAEELVEAAREGDAAHVTHEAADLLFHMLVLITRSGVTLEDVARELARRQGISGLEEKRRRGEK